MTKLCTVAALSVVALIVTIWSACSSGLGSPLFSIGLTALLSLVLPSIDVLFTSQIRLRYAWYRIRYRKRPVRISASYLFRIKVRDRYLLIEGSRFPQYQPVGGVFKVHPAGAAELEKLSRGEDGLLEFDRTLENDLRIRIPGRHLYGFLEWFELERGREYDGWREFYEELIIPEFLPRETFPYIAHQRVKRYHHKIRFSPHAKCLEILIADIFELVPNEEQITALESLESRGVEQLRWATEEEIRRRGSNNGEGKRLPIAEHASWLLR